MRKGLGLLLADISAYVSGATPLRSCADAADDWLHPVDADFYLDDAERYLGPFDADGLPMQRFGEAAPVYVPSRTAAYAFVHWSRWRRLGDPAHRDAFLGAARWFAAFPQGRIVHDFDLAGMAAPWISGLAQGEALSILARAELIEPGRWRQHFDPVFDWLERPIAGGGTLDTLPDGAPFIEEYPGSQHRHVLNGCLYALVGLIDRLRIAEDAGTRALLEAVAAGIERNIAGWEASGWSLYELHPGPLGAPPNFNTPGYQVVHIALLDYVGRHAGRPALAAAADRLRRALRSPPARIGALARKLRYRIVAGW